MLVNNERKRGAIKSVVRIFVEEDVIGCVLLAPDLVPAEQRHWARSLFRANNSVTLFTSEDVRLQAYANVDSNKRENYRKEMADELRLSFIAFDGDVDDQQFLEVSRTSDRLTLIDIHILKNIVCLLKQDCEAVITFYDGFREIYGRFLQNYGVSVLSLSEEFNINTIKNARYEWIERHLTSDPPNFALANQMTFEVIRRFAGDIDERYLDLSNWNAELFRSLPCSMITEINHLWNDHLHQQQNIFQEVGGDYNQFCKQVGWYQDGNCLSAEELYALGGTPESPHLPCIFHFIDDPERRESLYRAWLIRVVNCLST